MRVRVWVLFHKIKIKIKTTKNPPLVGNQQTGGGENGAVDGFGEGHMPFFFSRNLKRQLAVAHGRLEILREITFVTQ
jgi:hypothetical protein